MQHPVKFIAGVEKVYDFCAEQLNMVLNKHEITDTKNIINDFNKTKLDYLKQFIVIQQENHNGKTCNSSNAT